MIIDLTMKINHYPYKSFSSRIIGLLPFDDKEEPSSKFNNLGSITNKLSFLLVIDPKMLNIDDGSSLSSNVSEQRK